MPRSFIAIEIPAEIQSAIWKETASLRQRLGKPLVRWISQENIHLTLKFLGDVPLATLEALAQHLVPKLNRFPGFDLRVNGMGTFPNPRRPRVIWVGMNAPKELATIAQAIKSGTVHFGFEPEKRPFSPHLTIGRVSQHISGSQSQQIAASLEQNRIEYLGTATIRSVEIFLSDLRPSGAVYTHLHTLPLSAH